MFYVSGLSVINTMAMYRNNSIQLSISSPSLTQDQHCNDNQNLKQGTDNMTLHQGDNIVPELLSCFADILETWDISNVAASQDGISALI